MQGEAMTEADFTLAVADDPTGMANLIFADWLEEQGRTVDAQFLRSGAIADGCHWYWYFGYGGYGGYGGDGGYGGRS
jgi:uncharacterized protein (TIGR02996 family)